MVVFGRGRVGGYNQSGRSFPNRGSIPSNGLSKRPTTARQPSRARATTDPKCFQLGEPGNRIADCLKGEKYGKGLFVDSGGAFEKQGDGEEQEVEFDEDGGAEEEFVTGEANSGPLFMIRRVCFTPRKAEDGEE
jgi:hypothetical protein